jgi:hypothetical protein
MLNKRILFNSVLIIISLISLISCEQENTDRPLMTANVSGEDWRCAVPTASFSDSVFEIRGESHDGLSIILRVKTLNTGNFNLNNTGENGACLIPNKSQHAYHYRNGKTSHESYISITNINKKKQEISGTFYFEAHHPIDPVTRHVSNGKFQNVRYTTIESAGIVH